MDDDDGIVLTRRSSKKIVPAAPGEYALFPTTREATD